MTDRRITLVGDHIENPANARMMMDAAAMFGGRCVFRDGGELAAKWLASFGDTGLPRIGRAEMAEQFSPIIALDNLKGAADIYGYRLSPGPAPAVMVGNERKGLTQEMRELADQAVEIPMVSRRLNCLNVAAASAAALYYLARGGGSRIRASGRPERRRPEIMLIGGTDHFELGSSIRSAGAFGWDRLLLDDRSGVWFGAARAIQLEGRAAARRSRNPIHVIPARLTRSTLFRQAYIVSARRGAPLQTADLARGPEQVIVIPDESAVDIQREDWGWLAPEIRVVCLDLPVQPNPESGIFAVDPGDRPGSPAGPPVYHYRFGATIALAEIARQVGRPARHISSRPHRAAPEYELELKLDRMDGAEKLFLEDLLDY